MILTNQILIDYPFNFQKQKVIIINRLKYIDKVSTLIIMPKNTPNAKQFPTEDQSIGITIITQMILFYLFQSIGITIITKMILFYLFSSTIMKFKTFVCKNWN